MELHERPKNYAEATKASRTLALKAAMLDNARTFRCNRKDWGGRRKRRRKEEEEEEEGRGTPAQMHIRALERTTPCANRGRTLENWRGCCGRRQEDRKAPRSPSLRALVARGW